MFRNCPPNENKKWSAKLDGALSSEESLSARPIKFRNAVEIVFSLLGATMTMIVLLAQRVQILRLLSEEAINTKRLPFHQGNRASERSCDTAFACVEFDSCCSDARKNVAVTQEFFFFSLSFAVPFRGEKHDVSNARRTSKKNPSFTRCRGWRSR